jgi:antitoxin component of MazEF toxin-antitoxin module
MKTNIARWGASCAVRIPKMAVETLELYEGQRVTIRIEGDKLIIEKDLPNYTLEDLVEQMKTQEAPKMEWEDDGELWEWDPK